MSEFMVALISGYVLDLCFGDPYWMPHPVRLIGYLISGLEKGIRACFPKSNKGELAGGVCLVIAVLLVSTMAPFLLLAILGRIHPWLRAAAMTVMCYQLLATKALKVESMKVYDKLKEDDLEGARKAVSMIVGRDTQTLDDKGVTKAAVETIAENASDGVIAPMLFMAVGGPVLGFLYKAVNTMDSMVGYKNDRYLYFGRAAAKTDDIFNFVPARLSALFMAAASFFIGLDGKTAWKIFRRDRFNHASPNSAQTEAVCAGALNVRLAGDAWYFGRLYKKKTIGDDIRPIEDEDIVRANRLLYGTSAVSLVFCVVLCLVIQIIFC